MKLSASGVRASLLLALPCCALLFSISRGLFTRRVESVAPPSDERTLKPGELKQGTLDLSSARSLDYQLDIPPSSLVLSVELNCRQTDLELSLWSSDAGEDAGPDFRVVTEAGTGALSMSRFTEPPIAAGRSRLRIAWCSHSAPRSVDRKLDRVPFTIQAELVATRVDGDLAPGVMASGVIEPETGSFRTYKIEVPPDARALRFDIADALSDLDLFAQRGHPVRKLSEEVFFAQHNYGRETLVIDAHSTPPLRPGTWYVDVVDILDEERSTPFRLLATFESKAPAELLAIPVLASASLAPPGGNVPRDGRAAQPSQSILARALVGVVEISTDDGAGSGTLLTSDGWILTNAHVVMGLGGESLEEVVISVTLDPHRPSVEMFRARVDCIDAQRDLALVQIASGFYGQPLPADYAFPTVEMGDADVLAIGDPLWLVGYPSTGGQGSRVTITATRGVISGFDTVSFGTVLKTDATITLGNSGGAALDAQGRIVGVPTSTIELGSGHTGYVHPLTALPAEWRSRLTAPRARTK